MAWIFQGPGQHQHNQHLNGPGPPYRQDPWNVDPSGMRRPPPENWNDNRYAPNGSGRNHGFVNQPPNVMGHPIGYQPANQALPPAMMPPPNGKFPHEPNGQQRSDPGFVSVQNPGQPPQPFWKVQTEDCKYMLCTVLFCGMVLPRLMFHTLEVNIRFHCTPH